MIRRSGNRNLSNKSCAGSNQELETAEVVAAAGVFASLGLFSEKMLGVGTLEIMPPSDNEKVAVKRVEGV